MTRPVISAECPSPSCQRIDSVKKTLLKPPKKAIAKTAPAENEVCRSSAGFSSGSPPRRSARRSHAVSRASRTAQLPKHSQVQAGQPSCWPSTSGTSSRSSPAVSRLSPTGSKPRRVRISPRGSRQAASGIATAPMNRLTRKTHRQPSAAPAAAMMMPPSSGPIAVDTPMMAPSTPNAFERAGPVNEC